MHETRQRHVHLAALFVAAIGGCKQPSVEDRDASPSDSKPPPAPECGPFSVTVDGVAEPGLRPQVAIGEEINGMPAVLLKVHREPLDCSIESLRVTMADTWEPDDPGIDVTARGNIVSFSVRGRFTEVEGQGPTAPPVKDQPVSICITEAKAMTASMGPLEGKAVTVSGKATAVFCGNRADIHLYPPGG